MLLRLGPGSRAVVSGAYRQLASARRRRQVFWRLGLVLLLVPLFLQWLLANAIGSDARLFPTELLHARNLLLVTAHPDDECLFFSPTILGVLDRNPNVKGGLLVLSSGNNAGKGEQRKVEIQGSCAALGIDPARCEVLDHPQLQDNPKAWWDSGVIQTVVKEYIQKWDIDAIITFDEGGVSGHANHRAVHAAISQYVQEDDKAPTTYKLVTTALLRKYTFLLDLPLTSASFAWRILSALFYHLKTSVTEHDTKALVANSWHRYQRTRQAFASHQSQYSWDRHLYMVLCRYVWFNDLRRIPHDSR